MRTSFGRIARSDVTWDEEFQIFSVNSDVDEGSTRSEDISLDYDFFHSHLLEISCGNDYTAKVIPRDINVWTARLFLGDAMVFLFCTIRTWIRWYIGQRGCLPVGPARHCNLVFRTGGYAAVGGHAEANIKPNGRFAAWADVRSPCKGGFFMKTVWNWIQVALAAIGGGLGWFFGEMDGFFYALIAFVVIDYLTGVMCAIIDKTLSSNVGFKGIFRKVLIFVMVGIGHVIDTQLIGSGDAAAYCGDFLLHFQRRREPAGKCGPHRPAHPGEAQRGTGAAP